MSTYIHLIPVDDTPDAEARALVVKNLNGSPSAILGPLWSTIVDTTALNVGLATKQPIDSDLTALAALATMPYGRSLLALADAAAGLASLGAAPTVSPTFTGNVLVPNADAAGEALSYGQAGARVADLIVGTDPSTATKLGLNSLQSFAAATLNINALGNTVSMAGASNVIVPVADAPNEAVQKSQLDASVAALAATRTVGPIPPTNPSVGHLWLMTPEDHIAMYGSTGWLPMYPPTDNQAVTAGKAFLGVLGLWAAEDGN